MKLTDFENEKALELLADIIEPVSNIMTDKELVAEIKGGEKLKAIKTALTAHNKEVIAVLAALDGKTVETYHANIISMTKSLLEMLNDEELISVFRSQDQMISSVAFGPVTETTQDKEK